MTDTITLSDGTTTRAYEKTYGPERNSSKGIVTHVRKTAEADATPETLTIRHDAPDMKNQKLQVTIRRYKLDDVTQKLSPLTGWWGLEGDKVHWTQAEKEGMLTELAASLGVAGLKADVVLGRC